MCVCLDYDRPIAIVKIITGTMLLVFIHVWVRCGVTLLLMNLPHPESTLFVNVIYNKDRAESESLPECDKFECDGKTTQIYLVAVN